jgi:hypothetical protein
MPPHRLLAIRPYRGNPVGRILCVNATQEGDIRILAGDGTLLRQLTLDPNRDCLPRRVRPGRLKMSTMS